LKSIPYLSPSIATGTPTATGVAIAVAMSIVYRRIESCVGPSKTLSPKSCDGGGGSPAGWRR